MERARDGAPSLVIAYSVAAVLAGLFVGLVAFGRMERQFADVI